MADWNQNPNYDQQQTQYQPPTSGARRSRSPSPYGDPFTDPRVQRSPGYQMRQLAPQQPTQYHHPAPSTEDLGHHEMPYQHDPREESEPLYQGAGFQGGLYPPTRIQDPGVIRSSSPASRDGEWRRRQTIRRGVTRKVKLTSGNFIAEHRVPTAVMNAIEPRWRDAGGVNATTEFSHMRYTAATCDPDDFTRENGWTLRTAMYNRPTEILVAVTSYNENKILYARTLHGIMKNIRDICNTKQSRYWRKSSEEGVPGWQRVTVALIVDGLDKMDKSVLEILATVGVYQDGVMKHQVDGKKTVAHIFEYTTQLSIDSDPKLVLPHGDDPNNLVPVQLILVIKSENQKKINSHRWLFNAIARQLEPEICVLLDAGTQPGHKSIFYLWEAFYNDPNLGGACGEIHAMLDKGKKLINPLVAAQNFEYKMSNILDKPLESSFGYVSVLPGAFSAYRYRAIQGRPLEQYFHGDHSLADRLGKKGIYGMSIFTKNMFLAEDRILCFELVAKAGDQWTLTYVKPSKAETDVPESTAEFIGQRRRWLNGSFAASVYALVHFWNIYKTRHGIIRMFFFHIQAFYNAFSLLFSWFALANLWLTFSIIIDLLPDESQASPFFMFGTADVTHWVNLGFKWLYLAVLALQFVLALGNRPKGERLAYVASLCVYAVLAAYLLACSIVLTIKAFSGIDFSKANNAGDRFTTVLSGTNGTLMAALVATFGIYLLSSLLYRDPWHMVTCLLQYLLLAPSFTNVLNTYAFCNLHDVSWGTKGSDKEEVLPSVSSQKEKDNAIAVVEDIEKIQEDIDAQFQETVSKAVSKITTKEKPDPPTMDDQNRTFRTRLVAFWMLTNASLAILIENINGRRAAGTTDSQVASELRARQNQYFTFILWSTFGLSLTRFLGCLFYFVKRNVFRWFRRA